MRRGQYSSLLPHDLVRREAIISARPWDQDAALRGPCAWWAGRT
jgi:hypothetical protein